MSRVALVISLVLAASLTLIAAVLYRTPSVSGHPDDAPLTSLDVRRAHTVEVAYPDGRIVCALRAGRTLDWWIIMEPAGGETARAWPADQSTTRAALRLFDSLRDVRPAEADALGDLGATVRIITDEGSLTWRLAGRTFAGRGLLAAEYPGGSTRLVSVPAELHSLVMNPGPAIWRERLAFPGLSTVAGDVSHIELESPGHAVLLTRVEGRWWVHPGGDRNQGPLRASDAALRELLRTLSQVGIERFVDEPPPPADTGLAEPTATIVLASEHRDASGELRSRRRTLRIGESADLSAQTLFASLKDPHASAAAGRAIEPQVFRVNGAAIAALPASAEAFLDPVLLAVPAGDIGRVEIELKSGPSWHAVRTLDGWRIKKGDQLTALSEADRAMLDEVLHLATEAQASARLSTPTSAPLGRVNFLDLEGAPLGSFSIHTPDEGAIALATERVTRSYDAKLAPALVQWLAP